MSCEKKFKAAVNVVRNLVKSRSYHFSLDQFLRFYTYFKQATEGPNSTPSPNFWEGFKKMKWNAWSKLGNMSREQAMVSYVRELNMILHTMAYTDNVANLTSLDSFCDSVPAEDLELVMGPVVERIRSQTVGSPLSELPLASREASHQSGIQIPKHITSSLEKSPASSFLVPPSLPDIDEEEEVFVDTYEQTESENIEVLYVASENENFENSLRPMNGSAISPTADNRGRDREKERSRVPEKINVNSKEPTTNGLMDNGVGSNHEPPLSNGITYHSDASKPTDVSVAELRSNTLQVDISDVVQKTLSSLKKDIEILNIKLTAVEKKSRQMKTKSKPTNVPSWWPLRGVSVPSAVFLIVWPLTLQVLVIWIQRRRTHQT